MASSIPPKKNTAFIGYVALVSQADTKLFQVNPTLATGDAKVSIDGGAYANLATLPVVTPAGGRAVKISLSAAEMNGDSVVVQLVDAAGAEWCELTIAINTATSTQDEIEVKIDTIDNFVDIEIAQIIALIDNEIAAIIATLGTAGAGLTALATQGSVDTVDNLLDTEIAAIIASLTTIAAYLDTEIAAIKAKTDLIPGAPAAVGSAMVLDAGERNAIAAALLDLANAVETGMTMRQAVRLVTAALAGVLSGAGTTNVIIKGAGVATTRIDATVDVDGNRSALVLTP